MAKKFLDTDGLTYAFTKIKAFVASAVAVKAPLHAVSEGITTAGDGAAYTATVEGITSLTAGATFMMIPHVVSTSKTPTLNVNSLGAKTIRRRLSNSTTSTVAAATTNWLGASKPVRVIYDGTYWIADFTRPNATDLYGTLAIASGGTGATTAAAALTALGGQAQHSAVTATLSASSWSSNAQTVSVSGVTASNTVIVSPAPASHKAYGEAGVYCSAQATDSLTFTCESVPSAALTVNVTILN